MSDSISISNSHSYRFVKVEEYFADYKKWHKLEKAVSASFDQENKTLIIEFDNIDGEAGKRCSMLLQFLQKDIFRVRFNPLKTADDYTSKNTRSVVQDTFEDLRTILESQEPFFIEKNELEYEDRIELVTKSEDENYKENGIIWLEMKVVITYNPFKIQVFNYTNKYNPGKQEAFKVWETAEPGIYYTLNGNEKEDYAIIQAIKKPATAKYIGFGEQGGKSLCKNTAQVNYFNFDNMRYRQVYNVGPLDGREPLYHSDPFFLEFNGVPEEDSVYGIYIDNPAQVLVDIGYANSSRYMVGTRFGDLDYYCFLGYTAADIVSGFTSLVGRSRLKPRYALGYHQGCYGYEDRKALEWVVQKYWDYGIPLDGLHVDVDVQNNYQTFTIDTQKFPNPKEMFANLRAKGIKCSTNITPIISNKAPDYQTYKEGLESNYFVVDKRHNAEQTASWWYQDYTGGREYFNQPNRPNYNDGKPYTGEVFYGNPQGSDLGTPGHYPDFGRSEVRQWWGKQYKYLFEMGLEFVWQDMTTPAIRSTRGDMRSFPFRLLVTDDFISDEPPKETPFIKMWNLYSYNLHKATYHGLNHLANDFPETLGDRANKRNFIVGRGSFTGMHRFAALWTGDNSSSWDFLKMNVSQVISLGMCGMSICGQDIGGFEAEDDSQHWAGPELIMRWTAVGAFLPWFRNHYMRKGRKEFQEPFMYMEWFNGNPPEPQAQYRMVLPVCKYYIELRYRLLQLFYDAMFENCINGKPICRPMFLNDPSDKSLYNDKISFLDDQFFVGRDLLVAPILDEENQCRGKRDIYLPAGSDWYCFKNNRQPLDGAVEGGTTIRDFDARLSADPNHVNFIVPIYVRAGAIIPTIEVEQYVGQRKAEGLPNPITINIYPGESTNVADDEVGKKLSVQASYKMYLDDGVSRSSAPSREELPGSDEMGKGEYREVKIHHSGYPNPNFDWKTRIININRGHDNYSPSDKEEEKYFFVAVLHDPSELPKRDPISNQRSSSPLKSVSIDEQEIFLITGDNPEKRAEQLSKSKKNAWYYNEDIDISFIKVFDDSEAIRIRAEYF
ncbi:TIM-barrel domain-containing protein [Microcoleus sp. FACHB-68]|uniref:TIM-barrel domain-containing protein n=1 Tax=Microcoleus sp. FACHB-68 TaxID=2692826 RepID=UPI00168502CA|nr:TIM-barrel domain-containing protein [Microcoleus sp. FACHB-68]MBD1939369.1 alpha-glucosidase [Microcoleus sp. FACHB-68]